MEFGYNFPIDLLDDIRKIVILSESWVKGLTKYFNLFFSEISMYLLKDRLLPILGEKLQTYP